jgi:hypothetical protein
MSTSRMRVVRDATPVISDEETPGTLYLSNNAKTGLSVNASIRDSCRPTPACSIYCYGLVGRIAMPAALQRQAENSALFSVDEGDWAQLADEAVDVAHVVSRQQDFLRMFGVGDLQPGSVYFINQLSVYAKVAKPKFRIWVSTRKFDLAERLVDNKNLHVMLSFDVSTPAKWRTAGLKLLARRRPQFFAAWVRQEPGEVVPSWVDVVFEMHKHGHGRAKRAGHPKACPATIHEKFPGAQPLAGACSKCQWCFDSAKRAQGSPLVTINKTK